MRWCTKYLIAGWLLLGWACTPQAERDFYADLPPYVSPPAQPERNPLTEAGVALGEALFFDPGLSRDGNVPCASCHLPQRAFTDGRSLNRSGSSGRPLKRHSPTLVNVAWAPALFWDGGAADLESQAYGPLMHPDEMAVHLDSMVAYLQQHPSYPAQFAAAFGVAKEDISDVEVVRALAQYQRTLVYFDSRWDRAQRGAYGFTDLELEGQAIFSQQCQSCHPPPFFTDFGYHNTGLDSVFSAEGEGEYLGRYRISRQAEDVGKFKTPTLRNVAVTGPYLHDGRLGQLPQVLAHYQAGMVASPTLDSAFRQANGQLGLPLTEEDKAALMAFLHTLTEVAWDPTATADR